MIRIGVAGWDYPDWVGTVYPARVRKGFDKLAYLTRFVDLVEINTSFYRPVAPRRPAGRLGWRSFDATGSKGSGLPARRYAGSRAWRDGW